MAFVPLEYRDLYDTLEQSLEQSLAMLTGGTPGSALFGGAVVPANSNKGPGLLTQANLQASVGYAQALKDLGCGLVTLDINFPLLDPGFHDIQPYLGYYKPLVGAIRNKGLSLAIESEAIFPDYSSLPVEPYYAALTFAQYKQARADMLVTIANELLPDYLTVANEPDNEAANTGQPVGELANAVAAVDFYLAELKQANVSSNIRRGAGFGTWQTNYLAWANQYAQLPLDVLNVHIYPVVAGLFDRVTPIADIAAYYGKPIAIHECWLYKWQTGSSQGAGSNKEISALNAYEFWEPLDQKFLEAVVRLSHAKDVAYASPFWSNYFFAYLKYAQTKNLTPDDRLSQAVAEGVQADLAGEVSDTGSVYAELIA